ncbi:GNAT family N-acetyltransferase [Bacillus sp. REN16]|uniref:GNAT family N-acetyltransferase n=1 Tax=Bacillus sp. REN16 TaxID=2887296 RepID=UPI001E517B1D|nr:GNAT family N-acetyltransferase [Bacillus sp. REN16]MCC3359142.1 GNAT family N-acetyltransferase [Bacillus sp. REN16]
MINFEDLKGLHIKIATNDDTSKIIKMLKRIALWMKDNEINQWSFLLDGGDDEEIKQAISNRETYIVLKDNDIIATFTLSSNQSEWDRHIWGEDNSLKTIYLHRLAIIPIYMNKGFGRSILGWIQNNARDQSYLKLNCVADNIKLNNFYKNNEFELVGLTDGHSKYQKIIKNN